MSGSPYIFAINFNKIWLNRSTSQIYNAKILLKRFKAVYFYQAAERQLYIREFCPDHKNKQLYLRLKQTYGLGPLI